MAPSTGYVLLNGAGIPPETSMGRLSAPGRTTKRLVWEASVVTASRIRGAGDVFPAGRGPKFHSTLRTMSGIPQF